MPGFNVALLMQRHVSAQPERPALVCPSASWSDEAPAWDTWTFAELDHHSDAYARGLQAAGLRRGDRVLMMMRPHLDFYGVLFGLFKLGAVPVLLDPGMGVRALVACIGRTRARGVIAIPPVHAVRVLYARRAFAGAEVLITAGRRWFWGGCTLAACHQPSDEPFPSADLEGDDEAAIIFTSGSTGVAKGVSSRQAMFAAQVEALRQMFDFVPGQKDLQPFAGFALFDLCLGMTSILPAVDYSRPATARPEAILAAIRDQQPDVAFASPIIWQNTSRWCVERGVALPDSLKIVLTVGAAIPAYLHRRMQQILPEGAQVWTPYGATEAMPLSYVGTDEILGETWARTAKGAGTCVGGLAPGAWVRVIAITDAPIERWSDDLALPPNTLGEIVAGGELVSPEYKDAPDANVAAKIRDGERVLHRMGDLGYLDERGRLWFCGRKAHRVTLADGTVLGADAVEGIFNEHPDVFRTALLGLGDAGAQVPVLCVEMEPGRTYTADTERSLRELAVGTPVEGRISAFLPRSGSDGAGFPTDARHNSKIRREDLVGWAEARVARVPTGAAVARERRADG
jgi:olefin beta-lactone synthetase